MPDKDNEGTCPVPPGAGDPPLWAGELIDWQIAGHADPAAAGREEFGLSPLQVRPFGVELRSSGPAARPSAQLYVSVTAPDGQVGELAIEVQDGHVRFIPYVSDGEGRLADEPTFVAAAGYCDNIGVLLSVPDTPWPPEEDAMIEGTVP